MEFLVQEFDSLKSMKHHVSARQSQCTSSENSYCCAYVTIQGWEYKAEMES